jgi:hypothetical protein
MAVQRSHARRIDLECIEPAVARGILERCIEIEHLHGDNHHGERPDETI